jgi:hypothetical protein
MKAIFVIWNRKHSSTLATRKVRKILTISIETTVTMVFFNDQDKDLEGELVFPLDEGATVCGYAVDIKGCMVEAVVCDKDLARKAFETEVREKRSGKMSTVERRSYWRFKRLR